MEQNNKKGKKQNSKGFYIAVCCCVAALGITGYLTNKSKTEKSNTMSLPEPTNTASQSTPAPTQKSLPTLAPTVSPTPLPLPDPTDLPYDPTELPVQKSETVIETSTDPDDFDIVEVGEPYEFYQDNITTSVTVNSDPNFIMPVKGETAEAFSGDSLIFNSALDDWRSHNGIDILAESDTEVLAAADGVIKDIYTDYIGNVVVISHANGYETLYGCLKNTDNLTIGSDILQGDVLSNVSETPQGENVKQPHIHFEISKSGTPVNPLDIIG